MVAWNGKPPAQKKGKKYRLASHYYWYTPYIHLRPVRAVAGGRIFLDVASCALANRRVRARYYYAAEVGGLDPRSMWRNSYTATHRMTKMARTHTRLVEFKTLGWTPCLQNKVGFYAAKVCLLVVVKTCSISCTLILFRLSQRSKYWVGLAVRATTGYETLTTEQ